MKAIVHELGAGSLSVVDVPCPTPGPDEVLIASSYSVVSPGTERALVDFGAAGPLGKAKRLAEEPDRLRRVLEKMRTDGVDATVQAIRTRLSEPMPLGYANAGVVLEVGSAVAGFAVGDLVASNGPHADIVRVPMGLVVKVPAGVSARDASFASLGSIAVHAVRLAEVEFGSRVLVIGAGLIGQLVARVARANGAQVLVSETSSARRRFAADADFDVADPREGQLRVACGEFTDQRGADAVLVCTSSDSSDPLREAVDCARSGATVVLVGTGKVELDRRPLFDKELTLRVARSYGPGRYDPFYERGGDYPIEHVRWTARRNFEAFLHALRDGRLSVADLVTHELAIEEATGAYELIRGSAAETTLALRLRYNSTAVRGERTLDARSGEPVTIARSGHSVFRGGRPPAVALVGVGNFARSTLLPALAATDARLRTLADRSGVDARSAAETFGFELATTSVEEVLEDPEVDAVFIATRHDSHAELAARALAANKHVWLEKPVALTAADLATLSAAHEAAKREGVRLMAGFNRRFAPHILELSELVASASASFVFTINAGEVPSGHWVADPRVGGGRFLAEGCHFVDLAEFLGGPILEAHATHGPSGSLSAVLRHANATTTINYLTTGSRAFDKERIEAFVDGRVHVVENFRRLRSYGGGTSALRGALRRARGQDKGHTAAVRAFVDALTSGGAAPIDFGEIERGARVTLELVKRAEPTE